MALTTGTQGINLIKEFEGYNGNAYVCPAGVWTIGYGTTKYPNGKAVSKGDTCTKAEAETYLKSDVVKFERNVNTFDAKMKWNQNEFDALVSFAYNLGSINQLMTGSATGNASSPLRDRNTIAAKMLLYNKASGKVLAGLTRRREAERKLFLTAVSGTTSSSTSSSSTAANTEDRTTVKYFQKWLNENYKTGLTLDDKYGTLTKKAAIKALQTELNKQFKANLSADGIVGIKTKAALRTVKEGASGNITKAIQGLLICNGYKPGNIDGSFGSGTTKATKEFQKAKGLSADGIVGSKTWAKLLA